MVHISAVAEKNFERVGGADLYGPGQSSSVPARIGSRDTSAMGEEEIDSLGGETVVGGDDWNSRRLRAVR